MNNLMPPGQLPNIGNGTIYSADQIIGKTLFAKVPVPLRRLPSKTAQVVYTAQPGQAIGSVYSWVSSTPTELWWQYLDQNGTAYYTLHAPGLYSIDALEQQGALTVEEQVEQEQAQNAPWWENLFGAAGSGVNKIALYAGIALAAIVVLRK